MLTRPKINLVFDIDGVCLAQHASTNPSHYNDPLNDVNLPASWRNYHKNNIVSFQVKGINYYFLLLPYLVEMFHYFIIIRKDYVSISIFSAAPEERNHEFYLMLKYKIAAMAKVDPQTINFKVYSIHDCVLMLRNDVLQPCSANTPHIPDGCNFWNSSNKVYKKKLSRLFGNDTSTVILVDNNLEVTIYGETDNQLKVATFDSFSGSDFTTYHNDNATEEEKHFTNQSFIEDNNLFHQCNSASLIIGTIDAVIQSTLKSKISSVSALKELQVCPIKNLYRFAIPFYPLHQKYRLDLIYQGFTKLYTLYPNIQLFAPYPEFALDDLKLLCDQFFAAPQAEPERSVENIATIAPQDNTPTKQTDNQQEVKLPQQRRHAIISMETHAPICALLAAQGVFSKTTQEIAASTTNSLLHVDQSPSDIEESTIQARCCPIL